MTFRDPLDAANAKIAALQRELDETREGARADVDTDARVQALRLETQELKLRVLELTQELQQTQILAEQAQALHEVEVARLKAIQKVERERASAISAAEHERHRSLQQLRAAQVEEQSAALRRRVPADVAEHFRTLRAEFEAELRARRDRLSGLKDDASLPGVRGEPAPERLCGNDTYDSV